MYEPEGFTFVKRSFKLFFRCFLDHVLGSFGVFVIIFRTCGFFLVMRCAGDGNDLVVALDLHDGNTLGRAGAYADEGIPAAASSAFANADSASEAVEALIALGYSSTEARNAVSQVRGQADTPEDLIRLALRAMAGM